MEIVIGNRNVSAASTFTRGHMLRELEVQDLRYRKCAKFKY